MPYVLKKLSAIASSPSNMVAADTLVGVHGGNTDFQFSQTQIFATGLDTIGATQGDILYRGAGAWQVLPPGVAGQFLKTQGAGANPVWASAGGSGSLPVYNAVANTTVQITSGPGSGGTPNASPLNLYGGAGVATNGVGGGINIKSGAGNGSGSGGLFKIYAGNGGATGNGGALHQLAGSGVGGGNFSMNAGAGTSGGGGVFNITGGYSATGYGGGVYLAGGNSGTGTKYGGQISILAGTGGSAGGAGGKITIKAGAGLGGSAGGLAGLYSGAGNGTSAGGALKIYSGNGGATGAGGNITLKGGLGYKTLNINNGGGNIHIYGGNAGNSVNNIYGGEVYLKGGTGGGYSAGGKMILKAGNGGPTSTSQGGTCYLYGGNGQAAGGGFQLLGGTGLVKTSNGSKIRLYGGYSNGQGGGVQIYGGNAGSANYAGGPITIKSGAGHGVGAGANITLQMGTGSPNGNLKIVTLPTSDPSVSNAVWSKNGVLVLSGITNLPLFQATADQTLSGGVNVTSLSQATGNITVDCGARPLQFITNGGAFTITAPANDGSCFLLVTNNVSAGAITFSGFSVGTSTGDALDTVNTHAFTISIWRINGVSGYRVAAMQ